MRKLKVKNSKPVERALRRQAARTKPAGRSLFIGVDGGGTKTRAVLMDYEGNILGEAQAGPSNPLRVGVAAAVANIREAVDKACDAARASRAEVLAMEVGLAGARRHDLRASVSRALMQSIGIRDAEIVTDADIALYGATEGEAGLVVIAGTGSICCGLNKRNVHGCIGGWGPLAGDEGSGSWIARRALQTISHAADGRGPQTSLVRAACEYFRVTEPYDLLLALYAPSMTNSRIAGFSRHVVMEAKSGDHEARRIIGAAGMELGQMAVALIRKLAMQRQSFLLATVGGVFAAGSLVLSPMKREVERAAPRVRFTEPRMPPAVAAAHMARERFVQRLSLAS